MSTKRKSKNCVRRNTNVFDEYNLWKNIKMIVADTTNVNKRRQNEIVVQLQNKFAVKKLEEPQYIGCQHHILELVLRVIMDSEFGEKNIKKTFRKLL